MQTVTSPLKNVELSRRAAELVSAKPNLCWANAADVALHEQFRGATYVEGAVISPLTRFPLEHGWVVFGGEIIDPTLPDWELRYFPALHWSGDDFLRTFFKYETKPFYRHSEFTVDAVQVEMDRAKEAASKLAVTWI